MPLSTLPLSYCTNVHPGRTVAEVEEGLDRYTVGVAKAFGKPLAAGLWLAKPVVDELLSTAQGVTNFAAGLARRGLTCHTLNAFPFGDFHSTRVKEKVYLPDWSTRDRLTYTEQCAAILAELLPAGVDGSISTLPLGFKGFVHPADFAEQCATMLVAAAVSLADLKRRTGRMIRLAIEPEPFCVLETTEEAIAFFRQLWREADRLSAEPAVREHVGLCYDVCHQAVEFEDIAGSIRQFQSAGVRLNKIHLSCALQLDDPATNTAGRAELKRYVEERYLHQTMASLPGGKVARFVDLCEQLIDLPDADFLAAPAWRVHFHVPVDADRLGPLATTRPQLKEAIAAVASLDYAPHLEVETYTWQVLPGQTKPDLVTGLARELSATAELLSRR
ncbi:metabolite traffic protein EboE [Humisphaera borealis]|uniref:Metabolite traffic protein EboE n=1 Tax=Humisphaera borealis TaxID=2807512 RepID=A0A7M2WPA4_9BACT|nr:metabolite traffic protein EboE [Humisphaera borealis]QOV87355.1 metabolite traffic protein EboE [Humisphaera borealis]